MSSIGPQLPPHLAKRKRGPEDDENDAGANSPPPSKMRVAENKEEIPLEDSSDDDDGYGPSAPAKTANKPSIGPSLPPSTTIGPTLPPPSNTDEIPLNSSSDSDSDVGPSPAPAPRKIQGSTPPPAPLDQMPASDSEDSDDDYGPALPTSTSHQARQTQAQAALAATSRNDNPHPTRDDWMLAPPTSSRAPDPTKIKARKFNSGPRSGNGGGATGGEISSIWTETPEQKRKRLENAVLGRDDGTATSGVGAAGRSGGGEKATREEEERLDRIRDSISAARGPSLYERHQQKDGGKGGKIEQEEDDPSKRAFNWEKDMKLGSRISASQRNELLKRASDFGGRFSKGKYL